MKRGIAFLTLLLCFLSGCGRGEAQTACALCGDGEGRRYHAPCLAELSTGRVGELTVYDPHPWKEGELAEDQRTGTFSFLFCLEGRGYRDTVTHTCHLTLPEGKGPMRAEHFCRDCQALLEEASDGGYVLLDLYDLDGIRAYALCDGAEYTIRDYGLSVSWDEEEREFSIEVTGHIH